MTILTQREASRAAAGTFPALSKGKLSSRESTGEAPLSPGLSPGQRLPGGNPQPPSQPRSPPGLGAAHQQGELGGKEETGTEGEGRGRRVSARC